MLLLIDKPRWLTSHDAISAVKKYFRQSSPSDRRGNEGEVKKIWHAGTLDPMATGLIIAATDKDTKQLHHLTGLDKVYRTTIDFSHYSDTRDMDYYKEFGQVDPYHYESIPTRQQIDDALTSIHGTPNLPLTPFSSRRYQWKKLYEHARAGNLIHMNVPMTVIGHKIMSYEFPLLELELFVGMGTYIRSIGHRLGTQFGGDAVLTTLRRMRIGDYTLSNFENKKILTGQRDDQDIKFVIL